jgi:formate dehydrogenase subunit gamma
VQIVALQASVDRQALSINGQSALILDATARRVLFRTMQDRMPMGPYESWNEARAHAIIEAERHREGALLPILHGFMAAFGYVPEPAVPLIADALNLSRAEVHGVVTFYHDFRREPAGRHVVRLCRAESCQAMGCERLAAHLETRLGIPFGETTLDGAVTLEAVYCLGLCAQSPAAMIDDRVVARLDEGKLDRVLAEAVR